jgi:hypothetical protein
MNFSASYPVQIKLTKDAEFGDQTTYSSIDDLLILASDQEKNGIKGGVIPET